LSLASKRIPMENYLETLRKKREDMSHVCGEYEQFLRENKPLEHDSEVLRTKLETLLHQKNISDRIESLSSLRNAINECREEIEKWESLKFFKCVFQRPESTYFLSQYINYIGHFSENDPLIDKMDDCDVPGTETI